MEKKIYDLTNRIKDNKLNKSEKKSTNLVALYINGKKTFFNIGNYSEKDKINFIHSLMIAEMSRIKNPKSILTEFQKMQLFHNAIAKRGNNPTYGKAITEQPRAVAKNGKAGFTDLEAKENDKYLKGIGIAGLSLYIGPGYSAAMGGLSGLLGQGFADIANGEVSKTPVEDYLGSFLGGTIGGALPVNSNPMLASAIGASSTNMFKQILKNMTGAQKGYEYKTLALETVASMYITNKSLTPTKEMVANTLAGKVIEEATSIKKSKKSNSIIGKIFSGLGKSFGQLNHKKKRIGEDTLKGFRGVSKSVVTLPIKKIYRDSLKGFSGVSKSAKELPFKRIGKDVVTAVKGGAKGLKEIQNLDVKKHPEVAPFVHLLNSSKYQMSAPLDLMKNRRFNPLLATGLIDKVMYGATPFLNPTKLLPTVDSSITLVESTVKKTVDITNKTVDVIETKRESKRDSIRGKIFSGLGKSFGQLNDKKKRIGEDALRGFGEVSKSINKLPSKRIGKDIKKAVKGGEKGLNELISTPKKLHYGRNKFNIDIPKTEKEAIALAWLKLEKSESLYHIMGKGNKNNVKYVSPNGLREAIYYGENGVGKVGTLINSAENAATYNYFSPKGNILEKYAGHGIVDVLPYYIWGNSKKDKSTFAERITAGYKGVNHLETPLVKDINLTKSPLKKISTPKNITTLLNSNHKMDIANHGSIGKPNFKALAGGLVASTLLAVASPTIDTPQREFYIAPKSESVVNNHHTNVNITMPPNYTGSEDDLDHIKLATERGVDNAYKNIKMYDA